MAFPDGRVLVALEDPMLTWDPTWTALDQEYPNLVTSYQIDRGRQYELDQTDTGRATVELADVEGILDPTNTAGPFYGADPSGAPKIGPLRQIMLRRYNPVADVWETRFRGFIDGFDYALDPTQKLWRLTIQCVDLFEVLAAIQMFPNDWTDPQSGRFGHDPSAVSAEYATDVAGQVWYGPDLNGQTMENRIEDILDQAGIPVDYRVTFSGNVTVQPQTYSPGESPLNAIQETADAEFPGVANTYCDRHGRLCTHGRLARFDPAGVLAGALPGSWDYHTFKAGDGSYIALDPAQYAHVREFAFNRGLAKVINHALATPAGIEDDQVPGQLVLDDGSIEQYGYRSWSASNLLTFGGLIGSVSALEETKRFATYYVTNFRIPLNRVSALAFRSVQPGTPGASENWRLLSQVDVSDTVEVYVDAPEGGGFVGPQYFVEGVHESTQPLNELYDDVTLSLDLSPRAYFTSNPWGDT